MTHQRATIRNAIVTLLTAAGTDAGIRVYDNPFDPREAFPALTVEDDGEGQQIVGNAGPGQQNRLVERTAHYIVSAEIQQTTGYADQRDNLISQAEAALAAAAIAGVKSIIPAGYVTDFASDGARAIAVGRQRFDVTYITTQGDPSQTR